MEKKFAILILVFCSLILCTKVQAETDVLVLTQAHATIAAIDSLIENREIIPRFKAEDQLPLSQLHQDSTVILQWVESLKKTHSTKTGLDFSIGYDYKFGGRMYDDLYNEFVSYSNRVQAAVTWNILQSGLLGKKTFDEKSNLLGTKQALQYQDAAFKAELKEIYNQQEQIVNAFYNKAVESQIRLLESLLQLQGVLQNQGKILPSEIIDLHYRIALLKGNLRPSQYQANQFLNGQAYLEQQLKTDFAQIDTLIKQSSLVKNWETERQLLLNESKTAAYWKEMRISPFARFQYYDKGVTPQGGSQLAGSIGLTLTLPLSAETAAKRKEIQGRLQLHELELSQGKKELRTDLEMLIQDLNKNKDALQAACGAEKFYRERVLESRKLFQARRIPVQELYKEYDKCLDVQISVCDLIAKRELLMIRLAAAEKGFILIVRK